MAIYADNAVDCGNYYKMDAEINIYASQDILEAFHTEIRIKKDAVVLWQSGEGIKSLTLDEYANRYESGSENRAFSSCRMWGIVQDEQGYIVEFSDADAG